MTGAYFSIVWSSAGPGYFTGNGTWPDLFPHLTQPTSLFLASPDLRPKPEDCFVRHDALAPRRRASCTVAGIGERPVQNGAEAPSLSCCSYPKR